MQEEAPQFAAFIGIDWADRKHDVCLQVPGAAKPEASVLEHRPTVIDAWARHLRDRFGGRPIAVCVELAQGPIISALLEYEFFVIFPVNPSNAADVERQPATVAEAIDQAKAEYGSHLLFALNGKSKVDKNEFESPPEVLAALEFLATVYFQSRIGKKPCADLNGVLRQRCSGWTYSGHQSDITMRTYEEWYTTKTDGRKKVWLDEHIGTGVSKDERYTIRIGFSWSKELQKVIIGFIGQHQKTDAT